MSGSLEYSLTPHSSGPAREAEEYSRVSFNRPTAETRDMTGPRISFKLFLLFLLVLYSNISKMYPALEVLRPALTVAAAAVVMMVIELAVTGRGLRLAWPQSYLLLALLGVAGVSSFSAIYVRQAFDTTSDLSKMLLVYVLLENTVTSEGRVRTVMWTLVIGGLFPALGTLSHYARGILIEQTRGSWIGIFKNPNETAYALMLLVPLAVALARGSRRGVQAVLWGIIGAYVFAIYLTFSRGGLLALFGVLVLLGWKQRSPLIRTFMMGALALSLVLVALFWNRKDDFEDLRSDTTVNQRIATIKAGVLMFLDKPLLGIGPGCSLVAYPLYVPKDAHCGCQDQLVIHNAFIQVLSEIGLLGFIPFIGFIGFTLFQLWRSQRVREGPQMGALTHYLAGLELSLWGFVIAGMSGGFSYTWFPYILVGLAVATLRLCQLQLKPN
jgi:O-antigen ligase